MYLAIFEIEFFNDLICKLISGSNIRKGLNEHLQQNSSVTIPLRDAKYMWFKMHQPHALNMNALSMLTDGKSHMGGTFDKGWKNFKVLQATYLGQ